MSAILPPAERLWWKHPLDRVEGTWIVIALIWCLIMFFMMVGWHIYGKQNLSTETYKTTPKSSPPRRRPWSTSTPCGPRRLKRRRSSRRRRAAMSTWSRGCGISGRSSSWRRQDLPPASHVDGLQPRLLAAAGQHQHPDRARLRTRGDITPNQSGTYSVVCNEFCGINHHTMVGRIYVK
jgi:cytochrome c oxidase subunit 2